MVPHDAHDDASGPSGRGAIRHRATVLVVDDDVDTVDTMRQILEEEGHVVRCASNGKDALASVVADPPDLVLLDLEMPEMNGRELLLEMKRRPELDDVVVVILSGAPDADALPCESVRKPLRLNTLLGLIERVAHVA
jgi:two-component system CheB/CheR fusion protein